MSERRKHEKRAYGTEIKGIYDILLQPFSKYFSALAKIGV